MEITLTLTEAITYLAFSIGFLWGEAFSAFDGIVKYESDWYKKFDKVGQVVITGILDAMHHFQYGLALIIVADIYFSVHPLIWLFVRWLGWGLIISDWKDYRNVLLRFGVTPGGAPGTDPAEE